MSEELKQLLHMWKFEADMYKMALDRAQECSRNLLKVNELVYEKCKQEGIDIAEAIKTVKE